MFPYWAQLTLLSLSKEVWAFISEGAATALLIRGMRGSFRMDGPWRVADVLLAHERRHGGSGDNRIHKSWQRCQWWVKGDNTEDKAGRIGLSM